MMFKDFKLPNKAISIVSYGVLCLVAQLAYAVGQNVDPVASIHFWTEFLW